MQVEARESDDGVPVPMRLWNFLNRYMIDKRTGNVTLNIKDGQILGYRVEEIHTLK